MACDRFEELLPAYFDGDLGLDETGRVRAHLADCPDCRRLLAALAATREALCGFPELEVSEGLRSRLLAIPEQNRRFSFTLDFLLKPSLQPVFGAAAVFLTALSFYLFSPDRKSIDQVINQKIHYGYGQVEKLYARAGSITDRLDAYKDDLLVSIKNLKVFGGDKDQTRE
jgi:hypothetical protein